MGTGSGNGNGPFDGDFSVDFASAGRGENPFENELQDLAGNQNGPLDQLSLRNINFNPTDLLPGGPSGGSTQGYGTVGIGAQYQASPAPQLDVGVPQNFEAALSNDSVEALTNQYASLAFSLLRGRGLNPLRAEILGSLEFVPLSKGEDIQPDSSSISLNFGGDLQLKQVNQVVRLIELHRIIRNSFIQLSADMIAKFSGFSNSEQSSIKNFYSLYHFGESRLNLIFEKSFNGLSDNQIQALSFEEMFERVYNTSKDYESILSNGIMLSATVFQSVRGLSSTLELIKSSNLTIEKRRTIKAIVKSVLILSLLDEVQRFLKEIIDAKNYLLDSIDIKKLTKSDINSYSNTGTGSSIERFLSSFSTILFNNYLVADLGTGIENAASRISSNSVMFANLLSKIYSTCLFSRNLSIPTSEVDSGDNLIHLATNDEQSNNIRKGIINFKRIFAAHSSFIKTLASIDPGQSNVTFINSYGELSGYSVSGTDEPKKVMDYDNGFGLTSGAINSIINLIDTNGDIDDALATLLAYVCYDQVSGFNYRLAANNNSELDKKQIFPIRNLLARILFSPDGFVGGSASFYENYKDELSSSDAGDIGSIFRFNRSTSYEGLFKAVLKNRTSSLSQDPFAALEVSHVLDEIIFQREGGNGRTGVEVFLTDALLSGDVDLETFDSFIKEYEQAYKTALDSVVKFLGLDFDQDIASGGHSPYNEDVNLSNISNMNPANYFLYFMNVLGNDIYRYDDETLDALNMMFFCESGKSVDSIIKAFKSHFMGVLVTEPESGSLFCNLKPDKVSNKYYENLWDHYCEATDSIVKNVLNKVSGFTCKTYSRKYRINNPDKLRYEAVLSNNDAWISETKFKNASNTTKSFGNANSESFTTWTTANGLGHRGDTKDNLRDALRIYNESEKNTEEAGYDYPGGIKPSYQSKYLRNVMLNYPISNSVSLQGREISSQGDIDKFGVFKDLFQNSFYGFFDFQPDSELTQILFEINNGGQFGGIFTTSMFQRAFLFYAFAARIFAKNTQVDFIINTEQNSAYVKKYDSTLRGIEKALKGEAAPEYSNHNTSANLAYTNTRVLLNKVLSKMGSIRRNILQPFQVMGAQISKMKKAREALQNLLKTSNDINRNDYSRFVAVKLLRDNDFFNDSNLTNASETGLATIQKSIINNFTNPIDSPNSHSFLSLGDQYIEKDVKIMYKVLSSTGFGFNSNEKLGRKNIFHIGIPFGMLEALRQMAYDETRDERYLNSNKIAIHIVKEDDLNPELPFIPRTFVFDMDKFVLPKTLSGQTNHITSYSDSDSFEQTLQKIEFFKRGVSGLESYQIGAASIPGVPITKSYTYNHVFDYYLKLYCKITTGLDFDEDVFKISPSNVFDGSVDSSAINDFESFQQSLLQFYPAANVDFNTSIQFSRSLNISKNSLFFTPMNRFKSAISFNCFERVFTVMVNERDFLIPEQPFGIEYKDIFDQEPTTRFKADARQFITGLKYSPETVQILQDTNAFAFDQVGGDSILKGKIDEYLRGLNQDATHVSKYSIVVTLL